jgi:hypothetical protein
MADSVAFPFLRPRPEHLDVSPWLISVDDKDPVPLGSGIDGWDYDSTLRLSRTVSFGVDEVLADCGLRPGSLLGLQVLLSTASGGFRQKVHSTRIAGGEDLPVQIDIRPESRMLQGDLRLRTELLLTAARGAGHRFAPREAGTRLWHDSATASLEGSLSRFPVSAVDFREAFPDSAQAPWLLWWDPSALETNAAAAVRLYLNSAVPGAHDRLRDGEDSLSAVLTADIVRQILITLLHSEDFTADPGMWPEHSLGQVASGWLNDFFPEESDETMRQRLRQNPGKVEAAIHSAVAAGAG